MGDIRKIDTRQSKSDNIVSLADYERRTKRSAIESGGPFGEIILFTGVRYERMSPPETFNPEPLSSGDRSPRRRRR